MISNSAIKCCLIFNKQKIGVCINNQKWQFCRQKIDRRWLTKFAHL